MSTLDTILEHKRKEVEGLKDFFPVRILEKSIFFETPTISLKKSILQSNQSGIIAEIKRKSPSKGVINQNVSVEQISIGYVQAGATALSVLTDNQFFGGSNEDLSAARKLNRCPVLRKDFIIDEYQLVEAKSIGADVILLIASALDYKRAQTLASFAHSLGLEVLLEIHDQCELEKCINVNADLIGVNNRNLKTMEVDIHTSKKLAEYIPSHIVKISESGIEDPQTIIELRKYGYRGFLIGQTFMQHSQPELACKEFIELLNVEMKTS